MSDQDTGGPAFPHDASTVYGGMTLLDYFAGQAVVGFLTNPPLLNGKAGTRTQSDHAWMAYELADAMLAEKKRREGAAQ